MSEKKFTAKYFNDITPEWKRKKDPMLVRFIFRPISFYFASFCANRGITANDVSVFSIFVAVIACCCFYVDNYVVNVCGAITILIWLLCDCIDGNLARGVRHQAFGDYVDAMSSYTLVALLGVSIGLCVFRNGGIFLQAGNPFAIVIGSIASLGDTLMRLSYQKYKNTSYDLQQKGIIPLEKDVRTDHDSVRSIRVRLEQELGIACTMPIIILLGTIFMKLDLVLFYMLIYYGGSALVMLCVYVRKAMKYKDIMIK